MHSINLLLIIKSDLDEDNFLSKNHSQNTQKPESTKICKINSQKICRNV